MIYTVYNYELFWILSVEGKGQFKTAGTIPMYPEFLSKTDAQERGNMWQM